MNTRRRRRGVPRHPPRARRAQGHRNTVTVAAGDIVGASPLLSAAFHDEPTIEAMNKLGLEATAVGNHEFDEGYKELQRLQHGGCLDDGDGKDNQNSCAGTFRARFQPAPTSHATSPANVDHGTAGHRPGHDPAVVLDQELRPRREGRLHRHDPEGDPDHRHPGRRRRAWSSPTRSRPPTRSCPSCAARASRRSSCSSTRAAPRPCRSGSARTARPTTPTPPTTTPAARAAA